MATQDKWHLFPRVHEVPQPGDGFNNLIPAMNRNGFVKAKPETVKTIQEILRERQQNLGQEENRDNNLELKSRRPSSK